MTNPKTVLTLDVAFFFGAIVLWMIWPNVWNAIGIGVMAGIIFAKHIEPRMNAKMERIVDEHRVSQDQHSL